MKIITHFFPKYLCYPVGPSVGIRLRNESCEDPDKKPETCGIAYTFLDGVDRSLQGRGHNVVVVSAIKGTLQFEFDDQFNGLFTNRRRNYFFHIPN